MNRRRFFGRIFGFGVVFGLTILLSTSVFALNNSQLKMFSQNNILFYNPSGCIPSTRSEYASGMESYGGLSANQVGFVETYHDIAVSLSVQYGIPWETVMAQGILESAAGTSDFAVERNNFFGIGAFDSNPGNAYSYATPEEGWAGYYKNIAVTSTYRNHGVFAGETVTDPYEYLSAIKAAGYATDENYVSKVGSIIGMIEGYSKEKGWASSAELAEEYPEWKENAEENRQGASGEYESTVVPICDPNSDDGSSGGGSGDGTDSGEEVHSGELVSGGMTLAEAQAFMEAYRIESDKFEKNDVMFDGALVTYIGCPDGALNNCSAFTQWFLNRYTSFGPSGAILHQGSSAVSSYLRENPNLINGGKVPKAYAIMSQGPSTGSADGWTNHTGIVLGIDVENDLIIIGEASCGMSNGKRVYAPRAMAYSLSKYTNNSSQFGPTYAYTDNILKGGL